MLTARKVEDLISIMDGTHISDGIIDHPAREPMYRKFRAVQEHYYMKEFEQAGKLMLELTTELSNLIKEEISIDPETISPTEFRKVWHKHMSRNKYYIG